MPQITIEQIKSLEELEISNPRFDAEYVCKELEKMEKDFYEYNISVLMDKGKAYEYEINKIATCHVENMKELDLSDDDDDSLAESERLSAMRDEFDILLEKAIPGSYEHKKIIKERQVLQNRIDGVLQKLYSIENDLKYKTEKYKPIIDSLKSVRDRADNLQNAAFKYTWHSSIKRFPYILIGNLTWVIPLLITIAADRISQITEPTLVFLQKEPNAAHNLMLFVVFIISTIIFDPLIKFVKVFLARKNFNHGIKLLRKYFDELTLVNTDLDLAIKNYNEQNKESTPN